MGIKKSIILIKEYMTYSKFTANSQRWEVLNRRGYPNIQQSIIGHSLRLEGKNITIGEGVFINNDVYIECQAPVIIGDNTAIGPGTRILTATHDSSNPACRAGVVTHHGVQIGKGCWIGANVTILPGTVIGDGAVIGAGAVVTSSLPPHSLSVGIPAKKIKDLPL
ncbi:acyltransferase [Rothia nasimurium]|uniref:acyltransferase n=1 Tax=Rothia nasimurium TaxID=85336 RepID=UPI001F2CDA75|nr:DapH/DapD/GlmU-related protein [Rothia nasimurium]